MNLKQSISSSDPVFEFLSDDLQGNILKSHGRNFAQHLFIQFTDKENAVKCIQKIILKKITTAKKQENDSKRRKANFRTGRCRFYNFSLSHFGYQLLDIPFLEPNSDAFIRGAKNDITVSKLNDENISEWDTPYQKDWHAVLIVASSGKADLKRSFNAIVKKIKPFTSDLHSERGEVIRNKENRPIEHFGYVDGISQPHLLSDKLDNGEVPTAKWNPKATLDLVLSKNNNEVTGSYFVFRKLEQDVIGFNKAVIETSKSLGVDPSFLGAQLVGRFKNGNPITLTPIQNPNGLVEKNDFNYDHDMNGSRCPFHSHIRKTNPRGANGIQAKMENPQMARRGITYGKDQAIKKGLLFMAHMSDISAQFEFMQKSWANNDSFPVGKTSKDPIIGQGNPHSNHKHNLSWNNTNDKELPPFRQFVHLKGAEYFFTPTISFFKSL